MEKKAVIYSRSTSEKPKKKFAKGLVIYSACFIVVILIGLALFWQYMKSYELSRPENFMNEFITTVNDDTVRIMMTQNSKVEASEFEDINTIYEQLYFSNLNNEQYKYRKMPGQYTDKSPVYIIYTDSADLCKVVLTSKGDNTAKFGFNLWQTDTFSVLDSVLNPEQKTLSITVPKLADVYVNDIEVSDSYVTDSSVAYSGYDDVMQPFDERPTGKKYEIQGIYLEADILVKDHKGITLELSKAENEYMYPLVIEETLSYNITAPKEARLYINGILLTEEYIENSEAYYTGFENLVTYTQIPPLNRYLVENLYSEPNIECYGEDGLSLEIAKLSDKKNIVYHYSESEKLKADYEQYALGFAKVYINFTTNATGDIWGYFPTLNAYLIQDSVLQTRLKSAIPSLYWVMGSTLEYNYLNVTDFRPISETCFTCQMSFSATQKTYYETKTLEDTFELVFMLYNNKWRVADMLSE
ncbi:MAG TPA: hypothetical protein PK705_09195 [Clostridia bacterium]|nr:hypothetical protein [Clostridia bacterium]